MVLVLESQGKHAKSCQIRAFPDIFKGGSAYGQLTRNREHAWQAAVSALPNALKQPSRPLAAANAHRHDAVIGFAALHLVR